jgi:hypothetical protein
MSVDFSKYRSPTELRIQWMRLYGHTSEEIIRCIENGEVQSLEEEQFYFNKAIEHVCEKCVGEIKEKMDKICESVSDYLVFYA